MIDKLKAILVRIIEDIGESLGDDPLHVVKVGGVDRSPLFPHANPNSKEPFQRMADLRHMPLAGPQNARMPTVNRRRIMSVGAIFAVSRIRAFPFTAINVKTIPSRRRRRASGFVLQIGAFVLSAPGIPSERVSLVATTVALQ
ncbi:hypothetical protein H3V53_34775 [Paraburkholderia bengalensis]|uniref:Uncharacterized protein n=1 Tax=Paraburkholderia bengalensis TaxID=2747562 RepID=A0ABU8J332_9BURK